jgi:hypothetical protein
VSPPPGSSRRRRRRSRITTECWLDGARGTAIGFPQVRVVPLFESIPKLWLISHAEGATCTFETKLCKGSTLLKASWPVQGIKYFYYCRINQIPSFCPNIVKKILVL